MTFAAAALCVVAGATAGVVRWSAADASERGAAVAPRFAAPAATYHGYDAMRALVEGWIAADPERVERVDVGVSAGGLMVPALAFTSGAEPPEGLGEVETRTILLVGALDGRSQAGAEAVLHATHALLDQIDHLPLGLEIVAIPWASPDGLARVHAGALPTGRNAAPVDDDEDGRVDEDAGDDVDGDGLVMEMLLPDPEGPWCMTEDPRFLALAGPGDAPRYVRTIEGRDDDGDGLFNEDGPGGVVLDAQFPTGWRGPGANGAAGRRPLSEQVARGLADLVLERNVTLALVFQGAHGGVAFPRSYAHDGASEGAQTDVHRRLAVAFAKATGRPERDAAADGAVRGGRAIDWLHAVLGVTAVEVAVWGSDVVGPDGRPVTDPVRGARPLDHSGEVLRGGREMTDEQRRWARWLDDVRGGAGFLDWHPVDLGDGVVGWVGGWEARTRTDPPEESLRYALEGVPRFVQGVVLGVPRLSIELVEVRRSGELVELDVRITNRGALPTHMGDRVHAGAGEVTVRVDAACDAAVLAGAPEHTLVSLAGGETSRTMRWVLAAPTGASLEITATSRHAGVAAREVRP